jgi:YHS domain-containing protein
MKRFFVMMSVVAGFVVAGAMSAEDKKVEVKCPVSGQPINKEASVDYKDGKVYFCCENCPKAFAKDTKKFAAKANFQLVATEQAKQVKCPIAGRDINEAQSVEVNGVKVAFCCGNCKGKAAKAEDKVALIFSDDNFKKGYKVEKKS